MLWKHVIGLAAVLGAGATIKLEAQAHVLISSPVPTRDEVSLLSPAWARVREQMILAVQRDLRTIVPPATVIRSVAKRPSALTIKSECRQKGKEQA
jgi:hypothetical protein